MRLGYMLFCLVLVLFACRPAKKVQKIQTAISKKDTSQPILINNAAKDSIDESRLYYNSIVSKNIQFSSFNAKVRVEYDGTEGGDEATAFIRIKKDSAIWLSLRGALGIEGFRVMITRDSVKVMNLLKKTIQLRSIAYLQEMTQLPFDFVTLQDLIIGNPIFIDSNIISYKTDANNQLNIMMAGKYFKHLVTLENKTFLLLHSKLDDIDPLRNRTCDITLEGYDNAAGFPFSTIRKISVAERSKLDINLDFKQYTFNQPQTFPFSVPKNYKREYQN